MPESFYSITKTLIRLETPLAELNQFCDYMWQEFLSPAPPDKTAAQITVLPSADQPDCFSIWKQGKIAFDWGRELHAVPSALLSKALENIVSGHAINQIDKQELITLHAGAVSRNNSAILLLGESGHGKSTLTLELIANHGWAYLTDEVGLLDAGQIVHPFLKTVSCKETGIVRLAPSWPVRSFGADHQIAVPKAIHGKPAPLHSIFFVRYDPDKPPSLAPMKKSAALLRLMNAQIGRAKSVASIEQMAEVVKKANAFQLIHNDATAAARLLTEHIETV
ncbi:HPr kinase/phosphorylase C-terminal domain-containing protein [Candidatus Electronema halotolerans]